MSKKRPSVNKRHKQQKIDRAISRRKRNETRRGVRDNFYEFRFNPTSHLLFVLDEDENTETVLLQKYNMSSIEGGVLLALPMLTEEMLYDYITNVAPINNDTKCLAERDDKLLRNIIRHYYSIEPGEIIKTEKVIFVKGCKKIERNIHLIEATVQPYTGKRWFEGETTTIHGYKIHNGNRLRKFIKIAWKDLDKVYMFQDTLSEFAVYKGMQNKINFPKYYFWYQTYARRGAADLFWTGIGFDPYATYESKEEESTPTSMIEVHYTEEGNSTKQDLDNQDPDDIEL